jgi:hypothetical protein
VKKLAGELRAANRLNRELVQHAIAIRSQVVEMDLMVRPVGRVLLVDMPPYRAGEDHGAVKVYHDPAIDFACVKSPVNDQHDEFEELLERSMVVGKIPKRFQRMPFEISIGAPTTWVRWIGKDEVAALLSAEQTQAVVDCLNELNDKAAEPF